MVVGISIFGIGVFLWSVLFFFADINAKKKISETVEKKRSEEVELEQKQGQSRQDKQRKLDARHIVEYWIEEGEDGHSYRVRSLNAIGEEDTYDYSAIKECREHIRTEKALIKGYWAKRNRERLDYAWKQVEHTPATDLVPAQFNPLGKRSLFDQEFEPPPFVKLQVEGAGAYVVRRDDLASALDGELADVAFGEVVLRFNTIDITQQQYDELPEFEGH